MEQVILAIDIGSSKICSVIAEIKAGTPHIIGIGVQPSKGIRKGTIVNIEQASRSIRESVSDARRIAGINISQAIISFSGAYAKSVSSRGILQVHNEIGIGEINRVMQNALYDAHIPSNHEVIHVLPYFFKIDGQDYVDDPFGMSSTRLEVFVHIVTAEKSRLENLKKAIHNAGIEVNGIVLNAYASSIAVLNNDEKELGVACIDMGASSCDIMIHQGNAMRYNYFLGVGSGHVTQDIMVVLSTTPAAAEEIKINYATLYDLTPEEINYTLEIPSIGNDEKRSVSLEILHGVVTSRVLEILQMVENAIEISELRNNLGAGIVITGGMAHMKGLRELTTNVFKNLPVRIATPKEINGSFDSLKDPAYATVIGLVLYGAGEYTNYELDSNKKLKYKQNKLAEKSNLTDLNKDDDLSDLMIPKNEDNKATKNNVEIKVNRVKNKTSITEKCINFLKELF